MPCDPCIKSHDIDERHAFTMVDEHGDRFNISVLACAKHSAIIAKAVHEYVNAQIQLKEMGRNILTTDDLPTE